jgi:TonB family protein
MKKEFGSIGALALVLIAVIGFSTFAQQRQPADRVFVEGERIMQGPEQVLLPPGPPAPGDFVFLATEMSFGGKLVRGAPYSAQAVTENTQILSDGNRIVNKSTAAVYRDSEGRTRREQTLRAIGGFANGGEPPQTIFINDPVVGTSYTLDPRTHLAHKMPPMRFKFESKAPPPSEKGVVLTESLSPDRIEVAPPGIAATTQPETSFVWGWQNHQGRTESLGKQSIEGVEAEGTRSTMTIPAGEIGNERAIEVVNERWYSPELQTVVMTRHSDPRFGEASYRLTNIDRSEPAKSLFEVPADYMLKPDPAIAGDNPGTTNNTAARNSSSGVITGGKLNAKAISLPNPVYPAIARQARASGNVTVQVTIDEDGSVISAQAVSGHPLLQSAAVTAARQAKFTPTKLSGQPVKVQGVVVYTFAIE